MIEQPDVMGDPKEAPLGPYKKAADDYCEHYSRPRRRVGVHLNGEVYQAQVNPRKFNAGYEDIEWD